MRPFVLHWALLPLLLLLRLNRRRCRRLERVTVLATLVTIADFKLTDQDGKPRTLKSLRGAPTLIFFGFTHCPDVCPAAMTKLKLLHDSARRCAAGGAGGPISVDGERDMPPPCTKQYLALFSPDFIGLTGNPRVVTDVAARFSAVAFKEQPDKTGNYQFFHSSQVFLVDQAGRLRASFRRIPREHGDGHPAGARRKGRLTIWGADR